MRTCIKASPLTAWLIGFIVTYACPTAVYSQTQDSCVNQAIHAWDITHARTRRQGLFLNLDKSTYETGSDIYFTAYQFNRKADTAGEDPHTLYVLLVELAGKTIVATDRFLIPKEGITNGLLSLPDSIEAGDYLVIAYTNNRLYDPLEPVYREEIHIRSVEEPPFGVKISPVRSNSLADSIHYRCQVTTSDGRLVSGAKFSYSVWVDGEKRLLGERTVDRSGDVELSLPPGDNRANAVILEARISRDKRSSRFWVPLNGPPNIWKIAYYPEGGSVVDGRPGRIAVQVRNLKGMGLLTGGLLCEDGKAVAHFQTNAFGFGTIACTAYSGHKYTVQLDDAEKGYLLAGEFPSIQKSGYSLHIPDGIVKDTLGIEIAAPVGGSHCIVMVYSDTYIFYIANLALLDSVGRLALSAHDWPVGLAKVVLLSEAGAILSERAILVRSPALRVDVKPDSAIYHRGSKVRLSISVTDAAGKGVEGSFTLASALSSSVEHVGGTDIQRYAMLEQFLHSNGEPLLPGNYFDDDTSIDLLLLTRFGKLHDWLNPGRDPMQTDLIISQNNREDYGTVRYQERRLRKPVTLLLFSSSPSTLITDSMGNFHMDYHALITPIGGRVIISVLNKKDKEQNEYGIDLKNSYDSVNRVLANSWYIPFRLEKDTSLPNEEIPEKQAFNSVRTLPRVVIKVNPGYDRYPAYYSKSCSDFVCISGVLNCPYHGAGRRPVDGEIMLDVSKNLGGTVVRYFANRNCPTSFLRSVNGIHEIKMSPDSNDEEVTGADSLSRQFRTTLLWQPDVHTDPNGNAVIYLDTNWLKGTFTNKIEGITLLGPASGSSRFKVTN
jgi:hypothetical protein